MAELFKEEGMTCDETSVTLRRYYPWGPKTIPFSSIKAVQRVTLSPSRGRARLWGSANIHLWANLDTKRTRKREGLILNVGKRVKPFITPDDTDTLENLLREKAGLGPAGPTVRSPFI
jgi:hypothetical protein